MATVGLPVGLSTMTRAAGTVVREGASARASSRGSTITFQLLGPVQLSDFGSGATVSLHQVRVPSGVVYGHPKIPHYARCRPKTRSGRERTKAQFAQIASRTLAAGASSKQRPSGT
jgi:hypothetical protein